MDVLQRCNGNVRFTAYPNTGHEMCTTAYENDELYNWLLQQKKRKNITKNI